MALRYRYSEARDLLRTILSDLRILSGDEIGPSGVAWQDVAGMLAVNLRMLADRIVAAREGRVANGYDVVFPSPEDL